MHRGRGGYLPGKSAKVAGQKALARSYSVSKNHLKRDVKVEEILNVDVVINESGIERILSESAEQTNKMQKRNDITKRLADARTRLNESIVVLEKLRLLSHPAEKDQKKQQDLEVEALRCLERHATYDEKSAINAIKRENSMVKRLQQWRKKLKELVRELEYKIHQAHAEMRSTEENNAKASMQRLALWREGERLVIVTVAGLESEDASQRTNFFAS